MSIQLGSLMTLTSLSNIRYEGTLHSYDPNERTVSLSDVRSFGTEGRRGGVNETGPGTSVYPLIVFKGSEIKDLTVKGPPPLPEDPAIVSAQAPEQQQQQAPTPSTPALLAPLTATRPTAAAATPAAARPQPPQPEPAYSPYYGGQAQPPVTKTVVANAPSAITATPAGSALNAGSTKLHIPPVVGVPAAAFGSNDEEHTRATPMPQVMFGTVNPSVATMPTSLPVASAPLAVPAPLPAPAPVYRGVVTSSAPLSMPRPPYNQTHQQRQYQGGRSWNQGDDVGNDGHSGHHGHHGHRGHHHYRSYPPAHDDHHGGGRTWHQPRPPRQPVVDPTWSVPKDEFDFEANNARFDKQFDASTVVDSTTITGQSSLDADGDDGASKYYNKSSSFFDNISSPQTVPGGEQRRQDNVHNLETFGQLSLGPSHGNRGRGGHGYRNHHGHHHGHYNNSAGGDDHTNNRGGQRRRYDNRPGDNNDNSRTRQPHQPHQPHQPRSNHGHDKNRFYYSRDHTTPPAATTSA